MFGRKPYTSDDTKIVLSFCNSNGGHVLAHWIRRELMKKLNYFSRQSIYLDNIETRHAYKKENGNVGSQPIQAVRHVGIKANDDDNGNDFFKKHTGNENIGSHGFGQVAADGRNFNLPVVGPDFRGVESGTLPIGAMFIDQDGVSADQATWLKAWEAAVHTANVIIQIQTPDYFSSGPCAQEMSKINGLLKKPGNKLKVIALTLSGEVPTIAADCRADVIPLIMTSTIKFHDNNPNSRQYNTFRGLEDCKKLRPSDLDRLSQILKRSGC